MRNRVAAVALAGVSGIGFPSVAAAAPPDDGPWQPFPNNGDIIVEDACGGSIRLAAGDVNQLVVKTKELNNGTFMLTIRGPFTWDVYFTPAGGSEVLLFDELDLDAKLTVVNRPDGSSTLTVDGPAVIIPGSNPASAAALIELTGSPLFYFAHGRYVEGYDADGNYSIQQMPSAIVPGCEAVADALGG